MSNQTPEFITVWRKTIPDSTRTLVRSSTIARVTPFTNINDEYDGSMMFFVDGTAMHVDESTVTITARLGAEL